MPLHTFKCSKCNFEETRRIHQEDLLWREFVLVKEGTEEEIAKLDFAKGDDPRELEVWEDVIYGKDLPDVVKCNKCKKKKAMFVPPSSLPTIKNSRNSYASLKERRRYAHEGMDKEQSEQFLKESVEASKERVKSGEQHYKKVVPNYEVLQKQGQVRRLNDQERADKIQNLKRTNQAITKDGTIGKASRK